MKIANMSNMTQQLNHTSWDIKGKLNPFMQMMQEIRYLMDNMKYSVAMDRLSVLLNSGSRDLKDHEQLCQGWLAECLFQTGQADKSIVPMSKALQLSIEYVRLYVIWL
jgi:hypothetical protein